MPTAYDQVAYPSHFQPLAHPEHLAAMGMLFGLHPSPAERSRILELGCGDGGHILPLAFSMPEAQIVGVDLAQAAVARGQEAVTALRLPNIHLRQMDLMDFPQDLGRFDYIIAHGVYSWVPRAVRDRILQVCREHLAENGIAYISYNAYPGCLLRQVSAQMMQFHTQHLDLEEREAAARAVLSQIADVAPPGGAYAAVLQAERRAIEQKTGGVLFHDDLAAINDPVLFSEFVDQAKAHDLQYLADAEYSDMADRCPRAEVIGLLNRLAGDDVVRREQYMDFIVGRAFRRTLLCHARATLDRPARADRLRGVRVATSARARPVPAGSPAGAEQFITQRGAAMTTQHPLGKATMHRLARAWPGSVEFDELAGLGDPGSASRHEDATTLGEFLLMAASAGLVDFHTFDAPFARKAGDRPTASALARWQATQGDMVSNMAGAMVRLEGALARPLLLLLDGTRNREALVGDLLKLMESGQITLTEGGRPVSARERGRELLSRDLEERLRMLAEMALLTA